MTHMIIHSEFFISIAFTPSTITHYSILNFIQISIQDIRFNYLKIYLNLKFIEFF